MPETFEFRMLISYYYSEPTEDAVIVNYCSQQSSWIHESIPNPSPLPKPISLRQLISLPKPISIPNQSPSPIHLPSQIHLSLHPVSLPSKTHLHHLTNYLPSTHLPSQTRLPPLPISLPKTIFIPKPTSLTTRFLPPVYDNRDDESLCLFHQLSVLAPVNQHQQLPPVQFVQIPSILTVQVDMIVPVMRLMTVLLGMSVEVSRSVSVNNRESFRVALKVSKLQELKTFTEMQQLTI